LFARNKSNKISQLHSAAEPTTANIYPPKSLFVIK
jgi:hypothetical protein